METWGSVTDWANVLIAFLSLVVGAFSLFGFIVVERKELSDWFQRRQNQPVVNQTTEEPNRLQLLPLPSVNRLSGINETVIKEKLSRTRIYSRILIGLCLGAVIHVFVFLLYGGLESNEMIIASILCACPGVAMLIRVLRCLFIERLPPGILLVELVETPIFACIIGFLAAMVLWLFTGDAAERAFYFILPSFLAAVMMLMFSWKNTPSEWLVHKIRSRK